VFYAIQEPTTRKPNKQPVPFVQMAPTHPNKAPSLQIIARHAEPHVNAKLGHILMAPSAPRVLLAFIQIIRRQNPAKSVQQTHTALEILEYVDLVC